MIVRWIISVFAFCLTVFGVVSQHQIAKPNQEILLQFNDVNLISKQTEYTIALIKKQLVGIGAINIQSHALKKGKLKITYFSEVHIEHVKEKFSQNHHSTLPAFTKNKAKDSSEFPIFPIDVSYNLDFCIIQKDTVLNGDFDTAILLDLKLNNDRYLDVNDAYAVNLNSRYNDNRVKVAYKVNARIPFQTINTFYVIPEVRAGPKC